MANIKNKVCLIVHDGWGVARQKGQKGDAIEAANSTTMDTLAKDYPSTLIEAHGLAVGLSDGLMGNSEVGHLNAGAGRVVWQDIVRINQSIKTREFHKNDKILESIEHAKKSSGGRLHLLGLVSDGGVHSHITHLYALLETAKEQGLSEVYVHFFGDGRDTAPKSSAGYMKELLQKTKEIGVGKVSTVVGRYYAMDRDKRWERVKVAVDGLVQGQGEKVDKPDDLVAKIEERYNNGETDEFLKPIIVSGDDSRIKDNDTLFFFNYRSDRMREICAVFGLEDKPMEVTIPKNLHITTMSRYNAEFPFPMAFPPQGMKNVLAEWLSVKGVKQVHIAETEKYAHVTFFFNGGVEKQFDGEERHMIPSPRVPTYDKQPEMSAQGVADKMAEVLDEGKAPFAMLNFAPPDMVGHTGNYEAAVKAVTATDKAVKTVYEAAKRNGYVLAITADHGNAEKMIDENGKPFTAHTTNPVPFILANVPKDSGIEMGNEQGALCDVAPTLLDIMGLDKPEEMTGKSLLAH